MREATGSDLYAEYWHEVGRARTSSALRMTVLMALGLQVGFTFLDRFAYPETFPFFLGMRMGVNALLVAILFWGRFRFPRASMNIFCLAIGLEILAMVYATDAFTSDYYGGLMLLMVGMPVLLPLTAKEAGATCGLLSTGFAVAPAFLPGPVPWDTFTIHLVLLVSCTVESVLASGFLNRIRVNEFAQRRELERARDHLKELDVAKSRFTANVHHELRTPLTLMLAPVEAMLSGEFGSFPDRCREYLRTVHVNGLRLLKLINNLLDLARVESRQVALQRKPLDLGRLCKDIATGARPMAERKQIDLRTEISPPLEVCADPDAVEKVLVNLLGNALKFTDPGGSITLSARTEGPNAHIVVSDTGIGIPRDQLERVFDRFAQIDASAKRAHEGTGIGLSLAQELVQLHGGRIWATSEGMGHGSQMHVLLPPGEADVEEEEVVRTDDGRALSLQRSFDSLAAEDVRSVEENQRYRVVELERTVQRWEDSQAESHAIETTSGTDRPEVLIAEDNADMRRLLAHLLEGEYRVRVAKNGLEALEMVRQRQPAVVLTDVMMPEMTGTELCRSIKQDPELAGIPVLLVTSKAEREMKIGGLELGADDYVTKPFHPRELLARVRSFVRLRVLQEQLADRNAELSTTLAELRDAQAQLIHREKMASLGQLVAGVAHEINNPVNFIQGNLYYLQEYTKSLVELVNSYDTVAEDAPTSIRDRLVDLREKADIDRILQDLESVFAGCREGVERTTQIVSDLRIFSRIGHPDIMTVKIEEALDSTLNLLRDRLKGVQLVREYGEVEPVECLAGQLNQVFMNLLSNAADALDGGGKLTVRTVQPGPQQVRVDVEDTGPGIPPERLERIFDPFFTTKEVGRGTGLGLSLCYGIVERHGGTITVESSEGAGSRFRVEIPTHMASSGGNPESSR